MKIFLIMIRVINLSPFFSGMALSKFHRRVLVTNLLVRNSKNVPLHVPKYEFEEIKTILLRKWNNRQTQYLFQNDTKQIKIKDIKQYQINENRYLCLLLAVADKNAPDASYEDFITGEARRLPKTEREGNILASHVLINETISNQYHLMLVEQVNGLSLGLIGRYLNYLMKEKEYAKQYTEARKTKFYRPIFEILGCQSNTIREALKTGVLQDIEFVKHEHCNGGFDEYGYVQEKKQEAQFVVKRGIQVNTIEPFFKGILNQFKQLKYDEMFVRIKNNNGRIKTTRIDTDIDVDKESILDQFFIQTAFVSDFSRPLDHVHEVVRDDLVNKMIEVAGQ